MSHLLSALLQLGFFMLAVRHLQDSVLLRMDVPARPVGRKWLMAVLTAMLLAVLHIGATVAVPGLLLLDPFAALLVIKPLFWVIATLPFIWLFKASFFTALKASGWAVFIAVAGDLIGRAALLLVGGTLLARPIAMAAGLGGMAVIVGVFYFLRRRQWARLAKLAESELSPDERAQLDDELQLGELASPPPGIDATARDVTPCAYCPTCAGAAPLGADRCPHCANPMSELELELLERLPLQYRWLGIFVGGMSVLLAMVSMVPLVNLLFVGLRFPVGDLAGAAMTGDKPPIVVTGGFLGIGAFLFLFFVGGLTLGALARRPIHRELAVGGVALTFVAWLIWVARAASSAGMLLSHPMLLVDFSGQPLLNGPMLVFLLSLNMLGLFVALGAGHLGLMLAERMTGETCCRRCGEVSPFALVRPACPRCGMRAKRSTTNWRWVAPVVSLTLLAFLLVTRLAGPSLGYYWSCDRAAPTAACTEVSNRYDSSLSVFAAASTTDESQPTIILHPSKYIGLMAPLFLLGPLWLTWRRRDIRAAAMAILLNGAGSLLGALSLLGFALGGRGFSGPIQLQLLALIAWSAAGGLGIAIGVKLRATYDYAKLLEKAV